MKHPQETRHALSLQQLCVFIQPAFVFDENVPAKIPVQTPRCQAKTPYCSSLSFFLFTTSFYFSRQDAKFLKHSLFLCAFASLRKIIL